MTKVYAPNRAYNGPGAGGVMFIDGVGETDNAAALAYFRNAGYGIDEPPARGEPAPARVGPEPVEPVVSVGEPLRDAAIAPLPKDFLPPINAGEADPHGPLVVSPGLHAVSPAPIRPGPVAVHDPAQQNRDESELAEAVLVQGVPVPEAVAAVAPPAPAPIAATPAIVTGGAPAKRATVGEWRDYAVAQGLDAVEAADMTKDQLVERFGG